MIREIKRIFGSQMMIITLAAISILPLIYGGLYLWAFWDPYGSIKNIPVAIVNTDTGATKAEDGGLKSYNFGNTVVEELKKNDAMKWHFVGKKEADAGLKNRTYYTEIIIPEDFSRNIISVDSDAPSKANIIFISRQASSFMASKFSDTVFVHFKAALTEKINKEYIDNIFTETRNSTDDLKKAVDGTNDLNDGLEQAKNGSSDLVDGLETFGNKLYDLKTGLNRLADGSNSLSEGFNVVQSGKSRSFSDGINYAADSSVTLDEGAQTLKSGAAAVDVGIGQVQTGVTSLTAGAKQSFDGMTGVVQLLTAYAAAHPEASSSAEFVQALGTAQAVAAGQNQVYLGLSSLQTNLAALKTGSGTLSGGSAQLAAGTAQMKSGLSDIKTGKDSLNDGVSQLKSGLADAKDGTQKLLDGLETIKNGQKDLLSGLKDAVSGTLELRDKLAKAFNTALGKTDKTKNDRQSTVMSAPVDIKDESVALVENNGTGFTPYFVPLSFWVGSMAVMFLIDFTLGGKSKSKSLADKTLTSFLVCIFQTVLLDLTMIKGLHLQVNHLEAFILFNMILACTFMSIQVFLAITLDLAGKFVGIILLMLQLTTSAGTYPFETIPPFFQKINPWLPMTYAVSALKEIVSGNDMTFALANTRIIFLFQLVFLALSFTYIIKPVTLLVTHTRYGKSNRQKT